MMMAAPAEDFSASEPTSKRGGPLEAYHAVKEAVHPATPPVREGVLGTSAYPFDNDPQSALVFHPHLPKRDDPASPSFPPESPSLLAGSPTVRSDDQIFLPSGPSPHTTSPPSHPQAPLPSPRFIRPQGDDTVSSSYIEPTTKSPFSAFRRGSLAAAMSLTSSSRKNADPVDFDRAARPRFSMAVSEAAMAAGSGAGRDTIEMTPVTRVHTTRQKTRVEMEDENARVVDRSKEDQAMAKWRKWIVEQPAQAGPSSSGTSPTVSRKSVSGLAHSPLTTLSPYHSTESTSMTPPRMSPSHKSSAEGSTGTSSPRSGLQPGSRPGSGIGQRNSGQSDRLEIYNTETMKALRDVELAVDDNMLSRAQRASAQSRRMSVNPRLADVENPFVDLAARLGSRRVRPMVIELVQALGHYVDAVWCLRFPDRPCPWVLPGTSTSLRPPMLARHASAESGGSSSSQSSEEPMWMSRMITAVQEGKASGHVSNPPTREDARFWQAEVTYALRDVDDVVGIYKGAMWAFKKAMVAGRYGEVQDGNVVRSDGEGGNITRLLNDLEEAIWGDAPPRATDMAYELPIDFDPYAIPTEMELASGGGGGGGLASFFSDSHDSQAHPVLTPPDEIYDVPDLQFDTARDGSSSPLSPVRTHTPPSAATPDPLGLEAFKIVGNEMTLEEIGRKRHQEWLASRNAAW